MDEVDAEEGANTCCNNSADSDADCVGDDARFAGMIAAPFRFEWQRPRDSKS